MKPELQITVTLTPEESGQLVLAVSQLGAATPALRAKLAGVFEAGDGTIRMQTTVSEAA